MEIFIDKIGQKDLASKKSILESDDDDVEFDDDEIILPIRDVSKTSKSLKKPKFDPRKDFDLDDFESDMGWTNPRKKQPQHGTSVDKIVQELTPLDKILKKSAIKPGFEQLNSVERIDVTDKKLRELRKRQREKTAGTKWFDMPATEMTDEIKRDLQIIQMRSVGKVMDAPLEFYNDRLTRKERKRTIVDELMADAEFSKFNKRKFKEIIDEKKKLNYKAHRHARRLKSKKNKK